MNSFYLFDDFIILVVFIIVNSVTPVSANTACHIEDNPIALNNNIIIHALWWVYIKNKSRESNIASIILIIEVKFKKICRTQFESCKMFKYF